jgi:hypothetical protein
MKSGWSSFFPCSHCGSQNVTGAGYCGNCGIKLYYNCPDCQGWVDVTFSNCPNCRLKLDWPAANAFRDSSSAPAVLLLMLGIVMLATGSIYLIVNNSGSVDAVSSKPGSAMAPTTSSNWLPAINTPQSFPAYQYNSTSIDNTGPADYSSYDLSPASTQDTPSSEMVLTIPATPPQFTDTGIYNPPGRSYLDTVYPTWGHCVGGRCSGNIQ